MVFAKHILNIYVCVSTLETLFFSKSNALFDVLSYYKKNPI